MHSSFRGKAGGRAAARAVSWLLALTMAAGLLALPAAADTRFIDNDHWIETSAQTVNTLYKNKASFVVMFFRYSCFNSNLRKTMVSQWMEQYGVDVYGVDVDQYGISSWAATGSVTLPVICIVEKGAVDSFTAKDSMRSIQKRLQEYLGVYDESEVDFSRLDQAVYAAYSTRASTASARYCEALADIPADIRTAASSMVSGKTTDREKVKAIYNWVTTNIYYNYGMVDGTVARRTSALATYQNRSSVCEGYANLTAALCNAVGIPCRVVTGFATGVDTESTVDQVWAVYTAYLADGDVSALGSKMAAYENHAWNEAYVDGKWIILDTTWGCNNEQYGIGYRITAAPTEDYFDPDLGWFSESHLFWGDYSSDLTVTAKASRVTVTGVLDEAEVAAAKNILLASFSAEGKMLECVTVTASGGGFSQTLTGSGGAAVVKVFLTDSGNRPVAPGYVGKVL